VNTDAYMLASDTDPERAQQHVHPQVRSASSRENECVEEGERGERRGRCVLEHEAAERRSQGARRVQLVCIVRNAGRVVAGVRRSSTDSAVRAFSHIWPSPWALGGTQTARKTLQGATGWRARPVSHTRS
jgi:hypothetical protein